MINSSTPINSTYAPTQTSVQPKASATSDSSDILSSFKEMLSTMMLTSSLSTSGQQTSLGAGDLMAPLMLMLLEKLIEGQLDTSTISTETTPETAASAASTGTAQEDISTTSTTSQSAKTEPSGRPVGGYLTQGFHAGHNGLDFGVVVGTPVKATMDGKVIYAGWNDQGYGNLVIVENGPYRTYYAHLSNIPVTIGDTVNAGATVGLSGNTGNSTGPHLHYEVRLNNVPIDPTSFTLGASA
jgi:murein DD-endopeptidase MepM/ murein hydrolase activator NlpD